MLCYLLLAVIGWRCWSAVEHYAFNVLRFLQHTTTVKELERHKRGTWTHNGSLAVHGRF